MKHALLTALLGVAALAAGGCNCTCQYLHCLKQQLCCCQPCCDPCAAPACDCADCGHADCGISMGLDCCSQGCGERYYGDWFADEHCDPCDCHGNWVGPSRYVGRPIACAGGAHGHAMPAHAVPGTRVIGSHPKTEPTPVERR